MRRRLALLGLFSVLALLTVLLARTASIPAPEHGIDGTPSLPRGVEAQRAARHLGEAIRFETVSHDPGALPATSNDAAFADLAAWLERTYPRLHAVARRELVNGKSLLFTWPGANASQRPVLLMAHLDVVPVAPSATRAWTHPPFGGVIAQDFVWGRGALDAKGSAIALLEAAETLAASGFVPACTVMLAFGHDEEIGGNDGNRRIAQELRARHVRLAWVLDEGGLIGRGLLPGVSSDVALVGIAEKGIASFRITARVVGGHSAMPPPLERTAIGKLSLALSQIADAPFRSEISGPSARMLEALAPAESFDNRVGLANLWLFEPWVVRAVSRTPAGAAQLRTVISPTMITGGIKENVLPPEASVVLNARIHPRDSVASVTRHVQRAVAGLGVTVRVLPGARGPSAVSNVDGAAFQYLGATIRASFPDTIVAPNLTVGATDSRHYLSLTDNVFRFIPVRFTPEDLARFHGTNERISVPGLGEAVAFYYRLLRGLGT